MSSQEREQTYFEKYLMRAWMRSLVAAANNDDAKYFKQSTQRQGEVRGQKSLLNVKKNKIKRVLMSLST